MARVNIYLPDELADEAREAGLNVSRLAQEALASALASSRTDQWLEAVSRLRPAGVSHEQVIAAVEAAKAEWDEANG